MSAELAEKHYESYLRERTELQRLAPWFAPQREAAHALAREQGLPSNKDEAWRFTNLRELAASTFAPLAGFESESAPLLPATRLDALDAFRLVFVDGCFRPELSRLEGLPQGFLATDLSAALDESSVSLEPYLGQLENSKQPWFAAMNTALFRGGCLLHVARGVQVAKPVHVRFLRSGRSGSVQPRMLVVLDAGAELTLLEEHRSVAAGLCNLVGEMHLASGAKLVHAKFVEEAASAHHIGALGAALGKGASLKTFSVVLGGALVRNEIEVHLNGSGATVDCDGLVLAGERQLIDHHLRIVHEVERTTSREHFRHILDGAAHAVFAGKVEVRPKAQKTDAVQHNRNLLLSDDARMNTMPQLEIEADDVRCTHGATLGRLDENALFYLRSRGIDRAVAQQLLVYAFASEMVERLPLAELQQEVKSHLFAKLSHDPLLEELS